jgi:hypothetical protein
MKRESFHMTPAEEIAHVRQQDEERRQALAELETHRQVILESEARQQAQRKSAATTREIEEREEALEVAEAKANEELDEVKAMNSEVMGARVRTLRDAQVAANRRRAAEDREADRAADRMLEEGRVRAVQIYAQREAALKKQRGAGRDVLVAQIDEHKRVASQDRQTRASEINAMREADEVRIGEDARLEAERRERQSEFRDELEAATVATHRRKIRDREREIEEAQAMVAYQSDLAEKEAARDAELARARAAREQDIAAIRKRQQKAIDTQAVVDELHARRVQEELERKEREKELAAAQRRERTAQEMWKDREEALTNRQKRLLEMARIEKAEFDRVARAQHDAREKARQEYDARQAASRQYRTELLADLAAREEERRTRPLRNLDETRHLQEMNDDYLQKLERIREAKLAQLAAEGVPEKYLADLRNRRFVLR